MSKGQRKKDDGRPDGRGEAGASAAIEIERLRRRFELFRDGHKPGSRIPDELRAAALGALDRGASGGQLHRACRVSSDQLRQWRSQLRREATEAGAGAEPAARVFDVIDDQAVLPSTPNAEPSSPELELRLGSWAVRISQLGG
jgi:transposase-like protein